jgi:integrase
MSYKLHREVREGRIVALSLGLPEVDAYLKFLKDRCRPNTWINYAYDFQVFFNTVQKPIAEVTPRDIFAFIESQREMSRPGRLGGKRAHQDCRLSNRTIKRRLSAVSGLYEYLRVCSDIPPKANPVPRGLVTRSTFWSNKFGNHGVSPLIRVPQTLPRPLDSEEVTRFVGSLRTQRDKAMVLLMLFGGLRKSEVLGLTLKDVDFGQRTVLITDGKGGHQRVVAVSETALKALLQYLNGERPPSSSPRLFLVLKGPRKGQPLSARGLDMVIEYHREQAGTLGVQCHRLRHTCLTRLRQAGMSLEALQAQAGHKSMTSTGIYLHLCPRELREEYLRMSELMLTTGRSK